jgi:hypothetical protein
VSQHLESDRKTKIEVARTILDRRSAGPILCITHSCSNGGDLPVRRTRAVVCSEASGPWQGVRRYFVTFTPNYQGELMRLRIMALAVVTAPKIGIAQALTGLYVRVEAGHAPAGADWRWGA